MLSFATVLFYIPSITDWKEKINQHGDNVDVNPIDYSLDYLNSFSPDKEVSFRLDLLNSANMELRSPHVKLLYQFFRNMAETSNANLIRSVDKDKDNRNIVWVGPTKQYFDTTKFNLTYQFLDNDSKLVILIILMKKCGAFIFLFI